MPRKEVSKPTENPILNQLTVEQLEFAKLQDYEGPKRSGPRLHRICGRTFYYRIPPFESVPGDFFVIRIHSE